MAVSQLDACSQLQDGPTISSIPFFVVHDLIFESSRYHIGEISILEISNPCVKCIF